VIIGSNIGTSIAGSLCSVIISDGLGGVKLTANSANQVTVPATTVSVTTTTGALLVSGGLGVGDSVYAKNRVGFVSTSNVSVVYQVYNSVANSLDTVFG
jgi:hypothetical protein